MCISTIKLLNNVTNCLTPLDYDTKLYGLLKINKNLGSLRPIVSGRIDSLFKISFGKTDAYICLKLTQNEFKGKKQQVIYSL